MFYLTQFWFCYWIEFACTKVGEQDDFINTVLTAILQTPQYVPQDLRYDILILVSINTPICIYSCYTYTLNTIFEILQNKINYVVLKEWAYYSAVILKQKTRDLKSNYVTNMCHLSISFVEKKKKVENGSHVLHIIFIIYWLYFFSWWSQFLHIAAQSRFIRHKFVFTLVGLCMWSWARLVFAQ